LGLAEPERRSRGNKFFWALTLIAVGLLILFHNLGYIREEIVRYWPVILILIGIKKLID
jgi:cadmium resistance protein CadD (predicted permease)